MFALVESGSITKMLNGNKGIQIGDLKYPRAIYTLWTEAERNAIGIYTVEYDDSNKKDEKWYINTNQSYAFADNKVTASYGSATAKKHADTKWTQQQIDDGEAPEGAENAVVFNNDTASFFIMMTGHLEDANEHPEVYCLPHRSSHWLHLGQLHNGMSRIKGRSHGKSLKDYILISGEGTYIVLRKSDLQWTELPSPLAQFRAKHHRIQTGKSPNSWFVYRGNTAEYSGTEGRCTEDFSELVKGAVWSPLVIPPTPTPFIVRVLNKREAWIVLVVLAVCAALIVQVQRKGKVL